MEAVQGEAHRLPQSGCAGPAYEAAVCSVWRSPTIQMQKGILLELCGKLQGAFS